MSTELLSRAEGPAHLVVLNRPERRNALTPSLAHALAQEIERIGDEGAARAILLSGAGGHFCVGLNLQWLSGLDSPPPVSTLQHGLAHFQSVILAIVRCPIPVIGLPAGSVAGFGLDLVLACDIRIAGASATFTSAFARMGLVPDGGSTLTLPRLIGVGRALRFLMTNETVDAETALRIGLVDEVVPDGDLEGCGRLLVEQISAGSAGSIRAIKRLCRAPELGVLEQSLTSEGAAQLQALQGPEFKQRLRAFLSPSASKSEHQ